jgi:hypothetical protein
MSDSSKKRQRPKLYERTRACECCKYPITQRHHLFAVAEFGESYITVQLCANCHELYHLLETESSRRSYTILWYFTRRCGEDDSRLVYLRGLIAETKEKLPVKRRQMEYSRQWAEALEQTKDLEKRVGVIPRGVRHFYRISSFDDCLIQRCENKEGARWVHYARLKTAEETRRTFLLAQARDDPGLWRRG